VLTNPLFAPLVGACAAILGAVLAVLGNHWAIWRRKSRQFHRDKRLELYLDLQGEEYEVRRWLGRVGHEPIKPEWFEINGRWSSLMLRMDLFAGRAARRRPGHRLSILRCGFTAHPPRSARRYSRSSSRPPLGRCPARTGGGIPLTHAADTLQLVAAIQRVDSEIVLQSIGRRLGRRLPARGVSAALHATSASDRTASAMRRPITSPLLSRVG
jgi:hypothetical protein